MRKLNHVEVIVLCYNNAHLIEGCLASLQNASVSRDVSIVCVDNASTDNTRDVLEEQSQNGNVEVIYSDQNLGYGGGNNLAIRELVQRGDCAPILIVNPDARAEPGVLDRLVDVLERNPEVGLVGPAVRDTVRYKLFHPNRPLFGLFRPRRLPEDQGTALVDRLGGAFLLIRPEIFRVVGDIEEDYFLYWEEVDFCYRARRLGWSCIQCLDVTVLHHPEQEERCHRVYYMWRNQVHFARRNGPAGLRGLLLVRRLLSPGVRWLVTYTVTGRFDLLAAALEGFWKGLLGERGRSDCRWADPARPRQQLW